jgi:hypothetical protein
MHILTMCLLLYFSTDSECFAKFLYLVFLQIHDILHIHVATHGLFPFNLADFHGLWEVSRSTNRYHSVTHKKFFYFWFGLCPTPHKRVGKPNQCLSKKHIEQC